MDDNYMHTYEERKAHIRELGQLVVDGLIPPGEWFKIIYHWTMFELHLRRKQNAYNKMIKHGKWLNNNEEIIMFRQELNADL